MTALPSIALVLLSLWYYYRENVGDYHVKIGTTKLAESEVIQTMCDHIDYKTYQPLFFASMPSYQEKKPLAGPVELFFQFTPYASVIQQAAIVPDGCLDIIFSNEKGTPSARVCGPVLSARQVVYLPNTTYFGVRFLPGYSESYLGIPTGELINKEIHLSELLKNRDIVYSVCEEQDFYKKIENFLRFLEHTFSGNTEVPVLLTYILNRIIKSNGTVRIDELADQAGYTSRYIHKVFVRHAGYSPKFFSRIIRFQNSLKYLSGSSDRKIVDIAAEAGYYDQSHFLTDFSKLATMKPHEILQAMVSSEEIELTNFLYFKSGTI